MLREKPRVGRAASGIRGVASTSLPGVGGIIVELRFECTGVEQASGTASKKELSRTNGMLVSEGLREMVLEIERLSFWATNQS